MTRPLETPASDADPRAPLDELELVRGVLSRSTPAWHEFLERYARLLTAVLRQQLAFETDDERRQVFVDLLHELYSGQLGRFEGRSSLATWLVVVTRARALDYLRHRHGRRRTPAGYERLGDFERRVFDLYYVEHLPLTGVLELAVRNGQPHETREVLAALEHIREVVDARFLQRADYDRAAVHTGAESGRELRYAVHVRVEHEIEAAEQSPEARALAAERTALCERVRVLRDGLPEEERRALELRFEHGRSAKEIAHILNLAGARRAYTIVERALRQLRIQLRDATEWWTA